MVAQLPDPLLGINTRYDTRTAKINPYREAVHKLNGGLVTWVNSAVFVFLSGLGKWELSHQVNINENVN